MSTLTADSTATTATIDPAAAAAILGCYPNDVISLQRQRVLPFRLTFAICSALASALQKTVGAALRDELAARRTADSELAAVIRRADARREAEAAARQTEVEKLAAERQAAEARRREQPTLAGTRRA